MQVVNACPMLLILVCSLFPPLETHILSKAGLITGWTIGYATLWSWKNRMRKSDIAPYVGLAISLVIYFFFVIGAIMFNVFASPAGSLLFPAKSS